MVLEVALQAVILGVASLIVESVNVTPVSLLPGAVLPGLHSPRSTMWALPQQGTLQWHFRFQQMGAPAKSFHLRVLNTFFVVKTDSNMFVLSSIACHLPFLISPLCSYNQADFLIQFIVDTRELIFYIFQILLQSSVIVSTESQKDTPAQLSRQKKK